MTVMKSERAAQLLEEIADLPTDGGRAAAGLQRGLSALEELPVFEDKAVTSRLRDVADVERSAASSIATGIASDLLRSISPGATEMTFACESTTGTEGPWHYLRVVSFRGTEAMSALYSYEITAVVRAPDPDVDPDELVYRRGTLRIATLTEPGFRVVHGLIVEAEELGATQGGMMYRIVLMPPLVRARHRTRCRIFLEKSTRKIIETVLQDDPDLSPGAGETVSPDGGDELDFTPAREKFTWRITDSSRIDDVATRPYCVQYNESDLAFVSRLLEEEGISYHFENGDGVCLLVLSDKDSGRSRLEPFAPLGPTIAGRAVAAMKLGARLRPRKVSLLDYNWKQPSLDMSVSTPARPGASELVDHEYPGRYTETPAMGQPLAVAKLDRLGVEASYAVGEGSCRALSVGSIFSLDHPHPRYDGEYLVTKMEVRGEQHGIIRSPSAGDTSNTPYSVVFECARRGKNGAAADSRFRPARSTPKPRILGSQTGFVTAEPSTQGAEIHVGGPPGAEIGCVRVKFHWDQDTARHAKEPTSCWVRVNQVFAGVGEGAVFHPRVGVEVIVDFEEGDPDRPIIVGRVYNGKNRPPGGAPTVSTFKTMTSPGNGAFNELTFDDTAGSEQIKMHTPFNWNSDAGNDRSEKVGVNSASSVGTDRTESTGSNRSATTGSNNSEVVAGNETITIGANQNITIGADQTLAVMANQTSSVTGAQTETVLGGRTTNITTSDDLTVTGPQTITVTAAQTTGYNATHDLTVGGAQSISVGGTQEIQVAGAQTLLSAASQTVDAPTQTINAHGSQTLQSTTLTVNASAVATVQTALLTLIGAGVVDVQAGQLVITSGPISMTGSQIGINAGPISINGSPVEINGGGLVNITAGLIKLN